MAKVVYADANSTTAMPPEVVQAWVGAVNRGDPLDGSAAVAKSTQRLLDKFRKQIDLESGLDADDFRYVFTSGAAEANILMLETCANAFRKKTKRKPHFVIGNAEPNSIRNYLEQMREQERCWFSYATTDPVAGVPTAETIQRVLHRNTCLVTISAANPLTGALANLPEIERACRVETFSQPKSGSTQMRRVALHTDASVLFARSLLYPNTLGIDAYSVSFHKLHGPPGFGFLALRKEFVESYKLQALISGRMLNLPGLAAAKVAHTYTLTDREEKNRQLAKCTSGIKRTLRAVLKCYDFPSTAPLGYEEAASAARQGESHWEIEKLFGENPPPWPTEAEVIFVGPGELQTLPNTILMALRTPSKKTSEQIQQELESVDKVLVHACAPDVWGSQLRALRVPSKFMDHMIRVSLPDSTTVEDARTIAKALVRVAQT